METQYSDQEIDIIIAKEGNSLCNDCKQPDPKWASVNNAVFVCTKCARKHQRLGKFKSYIKSIEVDVWEKGEIQILKHGGNLRYQQLLNNYRIPLMTDVEYKYSTKAAKYYRKLLSNEVREIHCELERPDLKSGIQLDDDEIINMPYETQFQPQEQQHSNQNVNKNPYLNQSQSNQIIGNEFDQMIKSIELIFSDIGNNINDTIKEKKWDVKFKEKSESALKFAKESGDYIKGKSKEVVESDMFQSLKVKAETGFELIKEKASEMIEKSNHYEDNNARRQFPNNQNQTNSNSNSNINSSNQNNNQPNQQVYISILDNETPGNDNDKGERNMS